MICPLFMVNFSLLLPFCSFLHCFLEDFYSFIGSPSTKYNSSTFVFISRSSCFLKVPLFIFVNSILFLFWFYEFVYFLTSLSDISSTVTVSSHHFLLSVLFLFPLSFVVLFPSLSVDECVLISVMLACFCKCLVACRCCFIFERESVWKAVVGHGWGLAAPGPSSHWKPKMASEDHRCLHSSSLSLVTFLRNPSGPRGPEVSLWKLSCTAADGGLVIFVIGDLIATSLLFLLV